MDWVKELHRFLVAEHDEKITEMEKNCYKAMESYKNKTYSVSQLKRDEFATAFLSNDIKQKIIIEPEQTDSTIIAAW